jgi:TPR repeat protein
MRPIIAVITVVSCFVLAACGSYHAKPATAVAAGCQFDTQCKADRICEAGKCTGPAPRVASKAPPPRPGSLTKPRPAPDCYEGNIQDCYDMGMKWVFGIGGPEDIAQARAYFHKACQGGHIFACMMLGLLLEEKSKGKARSAELKKCRVFVIDHYEAACQKGDIGACHDAARLLDGHALYKLGRDRTRAREMYDMACEGGIEEACKKPGKKK